MSAAFTAFGTRLASASAATLTPVRPTAPTNGIFVAYVTSKNNAVHACATAGWTKIDQRNSGAAYTASVWVGDKGAANPAFTWAGAVACAAQVVAYDEAEGVLEVGVGASSFNTGTTSPHSTTSIATTRKQSSVIYLDVAAIGTNLTTPAGWTSSRNDSSGTDVGSSSWGIKQLDASGSNSGAISAAGGVAAWVQWQLEIRQTAAAGHEVAKIDAGAWLDTSPGLSVGLVEAAAWLDVAPGLAINKIEAGAWLDAPTVPIGGARKRGAQIIG